MDFKGKTKEEAVREIREFIQKEIDLIEREELSSEAFSKAAWPYYQASNLGGKKRLRKLLKVIPNE